MREIAGKAVLCIDDDPGLLQFEKVFLQAFGFRVTTASNGAEGLAWLQQGDFSAVVLDYQMPEYDGLAVAAEIKRLYPKVPVIIYSGYPDQIPTSSLALVDAFVQKGSGPPSALVGVLERVLAPPVHGTRRFPRHRVLLPFMVLTGERQDRTSLRGVCNSLGEGGFGGVVDTDLAPGDVVWVKLRIPTAGTQIEAQAAVRYRKGAAHGFEFLSMPAVHKAELRRCFDNFVA
jgi:CheY-like chemotaxis protein